jgi:hypothetical protein
MSDEQPKWELLPRDPLAFFDLESPFDRKDLKRKYNRLIKLYKPEKSPEEFKRIRAAYEQLEDWLKDQDEGDAPRVPAAPVFDDRTYFQQKEAPKSVIDLGSVPLDQPPQEAPKGPSSLSKRYFNALSEEAHRGADPIRFLTHLLQGMRDFPNDRSLDVLVQNFIELNWDRDTLNQIFSLVLRYQPSNFYGLTLSGWHRYAALTSSSVWQEKIDQVEGHLLLDHPGAAFEFYQGLLFYHWSTVDIDWFKQKLDLIEDLGRNASDHSQFNMDLLQYLWDYRKVADGLIAGNGILEYVHEHIVLFCRDFTEQGARRFQDMHRELLVQGSAYIDALPEGDSRLNALFRVLNGLSLIALDELQIERPKREQMMNYMTFDAHYRKMSLGLRGVGAYWRICITLATVVPITLILILTGFYVLIEPLISGLSPAFKFMVMFLSMFFGYLALTKLANPIIQPLVSRQRDRFYHLYWRLEFLDFIHDTHIPAHELEQLLSAKARQQGLLSGNVVQEMRKDWALWFYSLSMMFA